MKKSLILFAAAIALVGCKKSSVEYTSENGNEIAVTAINTSLKAVLDNPVTLPDSCDHFNAFAWFNAEKPADTPVSADFSTVYLDNMPFTCSTTSNIWWGGNKTQGHTPYYWPKTGSLVFAGYYGNAGGATITYNPTADFDSLAVTGYSANYNTTQDKADDFMYFPVTAKSYNLNKIGGEVPVTFYHALSWITVKYYCTEKTEPDPTIEDIFQLNSVQIDTVYKTGDAKIIGTSDAAVCTWYNWSAQEAVDLGGGDKEVKEDSTIYGSEFFVLPQAGTSLTIEYSQKAFAGSSYVKQATKKYDITDTWEPGKHYTYELMFDANEILIKTTVVAWENVAATMVEVTE